MAWQPFTSFEEDLLDLQPDHNMVYGQLAYEAKRNTQGQGQGQEPRPSAHYDFLQTRQQRNEQLEEQHGPLSSKSREIRASLAMMEQIQLIAGTKPLGEHATMADWEDRSTVELEVVAMMRHFGMMSMAHGSLETLKAEGSSTVQTSDKSPKIHVISNGSQRLPLILDHKYFEPRKRGSSSNSSNSSSVYCDASALISDKSGSSEDSKYVTAKSFLDSSNGNSSLNDSHCSTSSAKSSSWSSDSSYVEVPYQRLEEIIPPARKNRKRRQLYERY